MAVSQQGRESPFSSSSLIVFPVFSFYPFRHVRGGSSVVLMYCFLMTNVVEPRVVCLLAV